MEIPFDTEYEVDNNLEAGKTELVNDGEKGEVTITTTRNEDGTITVNQNVTKEAKKKKIKIGTKTQGQLVDTDKVPFGYKVEFDPDFYKNYPDAVSYTHLRAHETPEHLVCRLLLEKKKQRVIMDAVKRIATVSYTHLTLPTTPYV